MEWERWREALAEALSTPGAPCIPKEAPVCHVCRCQVAAASLAATNGEDSSGPPQLTDSSDDEETCDPDNCESDDDMDKAMSALRAHIHMHGKGITIACSHIGTKSITSTPLS